MGIKQYKPTSPGRRISSVDDFADITKNAPEKSLTVTLQKHSGRNNQGKITVRHRGGGIRRRYRLVDFNLQKFDQPANVLAIEYDPNRNARIALLEYSDGVKTYIVAPHQLTVGSVIVSSKNKVDVLVGNRMPLGSIPPGTLVHNIELVPGTGGKIARSAGNGVLIMAIDGDSVQVKMPSGELRLFKAGCAATVGQVSNPDFANIRWGKAGRMRLRGRRPSVRGKAMNPVDHPHGGGEGNNSIGLKHPKTPQGKPALGVKTRRPGKSSNQYIVKRRNAK